MMMATMVASKNGTWKLCKGNMIAAYAKKQNTLYVLHAQLGRDQVNMVVDTTGELWHKRLCHMSQKGMWMPAEKDLLPKMENVLCTHNVLCSVLSMGQKDKLVIGIRR